MNIEGNRQNKPYRIAILNPYLQSSNTESAEVEVARRMELAANRLGLTVKMVAKSEEINDFEPDFVLAQSYQDPKLTRFPTYGTLTMPPKWVKNVNRFKRNILTYDAYMTMSDNVIDFVNHISTPTGKRMGNVYSTFSAPQTPFQELNLQNAKATYIGTNWDGNRHKNFFQQFKGSDYLRCYGPQKAWNTAIESQIYGGEVPFDGQAIYNTYRKNGIGLAISHFDFDSAGIPNTRMFEIPASSAVMIAGNNKLIKEIYGDTSLYIDTALSSEELFEAVAEQVDWVRRNQSKATEMAREANRIFCEKISLETLLGNVVSHFETHFSSRSRFNENSGTEKAQIDVLLPIISTESHAQSLANDLAKQQLKPGIVHLLFDATRQKDNDYLEEITNTLNQADIEVVATEIPEITPREIIGYAQKLSKRNPAKWFVFPSETDSLFPNHFKSCIDSLNRENLRPNKNNDISLIYSGVVDKASPMSSDLPELFPDDFCVQRNEHLRLGYFTLLDSDEEKQSIKHLHPGGVMIDASVLSKLEDVPATFAEMFTKMAQVNQPFFTCEVTCQRQVHQVENNLQVSIPHQRLH